MITLTKCRRYIVISVSNPIANKANDYNSRLYSLQKAISVNSSQIVLAESKMLIRPNPSTAMNQNLKDKISAAYTNRSNNRSKKRLNALSSIDMLKNYYKHKRSKHSQVRNAASIQLYDRYNTGTQRNQTKGHNHSVSGVRLGNSLIN